MYVRLDAVSSSLRAYTHKVLSICTSMCVFMSDTLVWHQVPFEPLSKSSNRILTLVHYFSLLCRHRMSLAFSVDTSNAFAHIVEDTLAETHIHTCKPGSARTFFLLELFCGTVCANATQIRKRPVWEQLLTSTNTQVKVCTCVYVCNTNAQTQIEL